MTLTLATQSPGEPEIFASLQGEGPSAGMPVAFLRLSPLQSRLCVVRHRLHLGF